MPDPRASSLRRVLLLLVAGAAAVLMGGCGRPGSGRPSGQGPAQPPAAAALPGRAAAGFPLTLKDALGHSVTFPAAPQRIVSMSPPLTETLFALGLGDRIVGVTQFCRVPPEAQKKEQIGGVMDPSEEKIISLKPDVVFATVGNPMAALQSLQKSGLRVFTTDPKTYDQVPESIETLARVCGVPEAGARLARSLRLCAQTVRRDVATVRGAPRARALVILGTDPLFTAGSATFVDDMLTLCGAQNVAGSKAGWYQFSVEMVVAADPQVIILASEHEPGAGEAVTKLQELRRREAWWGVSAVKSGRLGVIHSDLLLQTGPRLGDGLLLLARLIHPELYQPAAGQGSAGHHARP